MKHGIIKNRRRLKKKQNKKTDPVFSVSSGCFKSGLFNLFRAYLCKKTEFSLSPRQEESAVTRGERKHPPPLEGDFQAVESSENGFANSQSVQTLVFYAADVRVGRWRRNALPVTNAGKSSNTSSLSDMTIAPVAYPAAKTHLPLK